MREVNIFLNIPVTLKFVITFILLISFVIEFANRKFLTIYISKKRSD